MCAMVISDVVLLAFTMMIAQNSALFISSVLFDNVLMDTPQENKFLAVQQKKFNE
jgi:hypothetical protein